MLGPSFETPAEIAMLRRLGGDVVGMSTVAETIAAARCGLRTAALAIVVNRAAGAGGGTLTHAHTLAEGDRAAPRLAALIEAFCRRLANEGKDGR